MACYYCRHFDENEDEEKVASVKRREIIQSVEQTTGHCTLSPDWRKVTGLHYCSQFSPREAGLVGDFWCRMHEYYEMYEDEKAKRLKAEKKAKNAQANIRALVKGAKQ